MKPVIPIMPGDSRENTGRADHSTSKMVLFDRPGTAFLIPVWWNCLRAPLQLKSQFALWQIGTGWFLINTLLYTLAYISLIEITLQSGPVTLAQFGTAGGTKGPTAAALIAFLTMPLIVLRCQDIFVHSANGSDHVAEFTPFTRDEIFQAGTILGFIGAAAMPGLMIAHIFFGIGTLTGFGLAATSVLLFLPVLTTLALFDYQVVVRNFSNHWPGWLKLYAVAFALVGSYIPIFLTVTFPVKRMISDAIYFAAASANGTTYLVIVIATTVTLWTGMMLLLVYLSFSYARLLGHLPRWISHITDE